MIERTLLWTPRAKQRPRSHVIKGKAVTFTPRETVLAERELAEQWDIAPVEGPCAVTIDLSDHTVHVTVTTCPEAASRKLRGDIDNYSKLVLDALNGRAWVDDHQIVRMLARKV